MEKFIITLFIQPAIANDKSESVYLLDSRSPVKIFYGDSFLSWGNDDDLIGHVSGDTVLSRSSIYVSTTSDMNAIEAMARNLITLNPEEIYWVYEIRPNSDFYDIRHFLLYSALNTDNQTRYGAIMGQYYNFECQSE